MLTLTSYLKVTEKAVTNEHENEIWHNGYSMGMKEGAKELIKYLQHNINDEECGSTDANTIKMFIYDLWECITINDTFYKLCLPEEMPDNV